MLKTLSEEILVAQTEKYYNVLFVNAISRYSLYSNRSSGGSESHEIEGAVMDSELKKNKE